MTTNQNLSALVPSTQLSYTAPFHYGSAWTYGQPGSASVNATSGMGSVKAKATGAGPLSTAVQTSYAGVVLITPTDIFNSTTMPGSYEVRAALPAASISKGSFGYGLIGAWVIMYDFYPNLTLAYAGAQPLFSRTPAGSQTNVTIDQTFSWIWVQNHLYRSAVFLETAAFAASSSTTEADASIKLDSVTWQSASVFPNDTVAVPGAVAFPLQAYIGDKVTVFGFGFNATQNLKMKMIAVNMTNGKPYTGGTDQIVATGFHAASNGTFRQLFTAPMNSTPIPGNYIVRISNVTDPDNVDTFITMAVRPALLPLQPSALLLLSIMVVSIPVIIRMRRSAKPR